MLTNVISLPLPEQSPVNHVASTTKPQQNKLIRILLFLSLLVSTLSPAFSQNFNTIDQQLIWMGASTKIELPDDFELNLKFEERRFIFPDREQQRVIPDLQLTKKINERLKANVGLWVFTIFQPDTPFEPVNRKLFEWRPYFTFAYDTPGEQSFWTFAIISEYRLFMQSGGDDHFDNNLSHGVVRERLKAQYNRKLNDWLSIHLYEELHLNVASDIDIQTFDQNRLAAFGNFKLAPALTASLGYLYWFQPTAVEAQYFSRHIITTALNYTFKRKN